VRASAGGGEGVAGVGRGAARGGGGGTGRAGVAARGEGEAGGEGGGGGVLSAALVRGASSAMSARDGSLRSERSNASVRTSGGEVRSAAMCTMSDSKNATQMTRIVMTSPRSGGS